MTEPDSRSTPASLHLEDAVLHLTRATLAIKSASRARPDLVVRLGTPHAQLVEVLAQLQRVDSSNPHPDRS